MTTIQNLSDLQDRRIMMEKKLPPFGYAMILLVAFLLVFLTIWSTKNYRTYVSQSVGTVQASNKTYIMSSYSGTLTELNVSEGSYVNEGDLIAHIKSTDIDMQTDGYKSQLEIYENCWSACFESTPNFTCNSTVSSNFAFGIFSITSIASFISYCFPASNNFALSAYLFVCFFIFLPPLVLTSITSTLPLINFILLLQHPYFLLFLLPYSLLFLKKLRLNQAFFVLQLPLLVLLLF